MKKRVYSVYIYTDDFGEYGPVFYCSYPSKSRAVEVAKGLEFDSVVIDSNRHIIYKNY